MHDIDINRYFNKDIFSKNIYFQCSRADTTICINFTIHNSSRTTFSIRTTKKILQIMLLNGNSNNMNNYIVYSFDQQIPRKQKAPIKIIFSCLLCLYFVEKQSEEGDPEIDVSN